MRLGRSLLGAGLTATSLFLQACVTATPVAYGPIGPEAPYGYKDTKRSEGAYTVLVYMPGYSSPTELRAFFDRRAGELCPGGVERTNVFKVNARDYYSPAPYVYGSVGVGSRGRVGIELEGYVDCKPGPVAPATTAEAGK